MITPDDVRFAPADAPPHRAARCPVCGVRGDAAPVLSVPALTEPPVALTLLRCPACASLHYDPPGIRAFSDLGGEGAEFWRFYVEAGGGVWETIWPLLVAREKGTLLDVGCGFGFALDCWQRTGRGEAVGVELAEYGQAGARELGVTIHAELVEDCAALRGRRFDIVYASEVIEHVEAPNAFVELIGSRVADDGVLVMTTPSAGYITPARKGPTQLAALAPGFHGFLLSPRAFEASARKAGFAHVEVRTFGERQMLWASRHPLALDFDEARLRERYYAYMRERVASFELASSLGLGYAYRLLRDFTNTGRLGEAKGMAERIVAGATARYGPDALDRDRAVAAYARCESLADVGRVGPYFLPCYFQFAGALAQHVDRDYAGARACYRAAAALAREAVRIGTVYFLEAAAIVWPARIADAMLGLALGEDQAAATFADVADVGTEVLRANAFSTVEPGQIEALLPTVAEELAARHQWRAAGTIVDAYIRYVSRRYGADSVTLDSIAAKLDDARVLLPADPLFLPLFAGLALLEDSARLDEGRSLLARVAEVADGVQNAYAPRARAIAAKARRAAGNRAGKPVFEMSFKLS